MTNMSLSPDKMTPLTVAVFDLLVDGEWQDNSHLIAFGAEICAREERAEALKTGRRVRRKSLAAGKSISDEDLIASGAKDMVRNRLMIAVRAQRLERTKTQHRMTPTACAAWHAARPAATKQQGKAAAKATADKSQPDTRPALSVVPDVAPTPAAASAEAPKTRRNRNAEELIFGGIVEADGWEPAPLHLKSRVHFRVENDEVSLSDFRAALPVGSDVTYDEGTGLYRVDCDHGTGNEVRDFIRDWCAANDYKAKSLRAEHDVRRRNLGDLDPAFLSDLCLWYSRYSQGRIKKHHSTLQFHFTDRDDLGQQVFEWILEAVSRYDDKSGVPFGAFLSERIGKWVHDLNRNKYGRIVSDTELKYQRATQEFMTKFGRKPTEVELAEALGQDLTTLRKNAQVVSTVQGLRNIGTLDATADEGGEIALPDDEFCDDRHNAELEQSLLSQILTVSCEADPSARGKLATKPNVLGLVAWYESLWGGKNKTELSTGLGTSMRNMNEYAQRVEEKMKARKADLIG